MTQLSLIEVFLLIFMLPKIYLIDTRLLGEKCTPLIISEADGAPRAGPPETRRVNPWQHLVSPIRFANGGI